MEIGLAIAALAVAGAAGAFAFWATRWARSEAEGRHAADLTAAAAKAIAFDYKGALDDRNAALAAKQLELDHATAALRTAERQRDDLAQAAVEYAATHPGTLGPAVRAALERMRLVAHEAAGVPAAAPAAPAGAGDGAGAVPGADPGGPIGDRLLPMA